MKDFVQHGTKPFKKVIGQQVEQVYPQAVSTITDVVPDIMQPAEVNGEWVQLDTDLQAGERIKLIFDESQEVVEVLEVSKEGFRVELPKDANKVFVYGREVDDYRLVDYEAISMLNVSATQALYQQVQDLKKQLDGIELRMDNGKARA